MLPFTADTLTGLGAFSRDQHQLDLGIWPGTLSRFGSSWVCEQDSTFNLQEMLTAKSWKDLLSPAGGQKNENATDGKNREASWEDKDQP